MTEKYRFFASATGDDRLYDQADFAATFRAIQRDGIVVDLGAELLVTPTPTATMAVVVNTGGAWVQGYPYENDAVLTLAIDAADAANPRIDRIVIRLDELVNRDIRLRVIKGTASATPTPPAPTRANGIYDLVIANVTVPPGAPSITGANIANGPKADPDLCGYSAPRATGMDAVTIDRDLDMQGYRITDLATPQESGDAVNKAYADALGAGSGAVMPPGSLTFWAGPAGSPPSGWLLCDGSYQAIASYPALYAVIGTLYGSLSGQNFKLPDARSNLIGCYDSRYPGWTPIGSIHGEMAHAATSSGTQNLTQWLVVGGLIIKT